MSFVCFPKFSPVPPLGGEIPPKSPHLEISSDCLWIRYVSSVSHYLTNVFFSVFRNSPLFAPRGGLPPKFTKSRNLVRLSWNLVCMLCTTLLKECPFQYSETPPHFPPGGDFPPKIPKSRNLVRLSWNLVCMFSGTLLEDCQVFQSGYLSICQINMTLKAYEYDHKFVCVFVTLLTT